MYSDTKLIIRNNFTSSDFLIGKDTHNTLNITKFQLATILIYNYLYFHINEIL